MATIRELERGVWLDETVVPDDFRLDAESLCDLLSNCVADLVVSLSMFERAQIECRACLQAKLEAGRDRENREREAERQREREVELAAQAGITRDHPDHFEKSRPIREQARRELVRENWAREGGPETYRHRAPFICAQSFVSTLALLQRSLLALTKYPFDRRVAASIQRVCDDFAAALPGLKGVRDSVAHAEDRVRAEAFGKKIATQPVSNTLIHAPAGGAMVVSALNNECYGGTIADGTYVEVDVADATTEVARAAVQAVYDALPWKPGHRRIDPID
jgi:hypothetical protein